MKRVWSLSKASLLELIRDPIVTGLSMFFPLAFLGLYFVLPDLRISETVRVSALSFGLPTVVLLGALALGLWGTAAPMAQHRKDGALRNLGMTPVTPGMYLVAQIPGRAAVICAETILILLIAAATGTLHLQNGGLFLAAVTLCIASTLSLGLLFGSFSANPTLVGGVGGVLIPAILFACGVFIPFHMMPNVIEIIARFIPFTYIGDTLRHTITGLPLAYSPVLGAVVCLVWTTVAGALSVKLFRWGAK